MNFLSPWYVPAIAAGLTVPPLLLLYFLKLKRRQVPISSTLLWKRAVYDLQVNSPFQKLRNNLLLLLQLLMLVTVALALAEPTWSGTRTLNKTIVILIDQSASMSSREDDGSTRLEIAKREARRIVDEMNESQQSMIIAFASRARVLTPFTDNKNTLRQAIDSIQQTDEAGRLREAMQLAEAHSTPGEDVTAMEKSHYIVLTDGRLADAKDIVIERGSMEIARVGQSAENTGIVNLDVRRSYDNPEHLSVLVRVRNFGSEPVNRDISLIVDNQLKDVQSLPALTPLAGPDRLRTMQINGLAIPPEGNEATLSFELMLDHEAELTTRLSGQDALKTDDAAFAVIMPPKPISALLVTPGNRYLRAAVEATIGNFDQWSPDQYEEAPDEELIENGRCRYSVVILDGHSTERLPPGNYLFFESRPLIDEIQQGERVTAQPLLDWDDTHPVLRHVNVGTITVFSWIDLKLPPGAITLIEGSTGPVLALLQQQRHQYLLCAFSLFDESRTHLNTDWVFQDGLVVFMANAMRFLSGSSTIGQQPSTSPGSALTVAAKPDTGKVTVQRPDGSSEKVPVQASGLVTYGSTDKVGIYSISTGIPGEEARAVNLLDATESFITPNHDFRVASGEVTASESQGQAERPIWPYLLAAMGLILMIEWFVYCKRIFV